MKRIFSVIFVLIFAMPIAAQYGGDAGQFKGVYYVSQFPGSTLDAKLSACINSMGPLGGICDARGLGNSTLSANITVTAANVYVLLPCATITTAYQFIVSPGVRNTRIEGCTYQGGSNASGTTGGTVWNYTGTSSAFKVGDTTYAADTGGFYLSDMQINVASGTGATAISINRTVETTLERLYIIGAGTTSANGIYINGQGNYAGGYFDNIHITGFNDGLYLTGTSTGAVNGATFTRIHIDCPTSSGSPIAGTYGIYLGYGDWNTFTGGDVEGCATMFYLGAGASNNTIVGLRNENSTTQYNAASGSQYNMSVGGGTLYSAALTDAGTHNTFWDAFHRQFNNLNGDLYRSQADATITDHYYLGIGLGNVRGHLWEVQTDVPSTPSTYQNMWQWGMTDGTSGQDTFEWYDVLNNIIRLGAQQNTTAGGNAQTYVNSIGTGAFCVNCSANSGTGGMNVNGGGASPTSIWSVIGDGESYNYNTQHFYVTSTEYWKWAYSSSAFSLNDVSDPGSPKRITVYSGTNGGTDIDSNGTGAVTINNTSSGGTGGLIVYDGSAGSSTVAFSVSGAGAGYVAGNLQIGSASGTGNAVVGNHLNQLATGDFAGHCTMTTTTCTVSFQHSWNSTPSCTATPQGTTPYYAAVSVSSNVATITANASNTAVWSVHCVGDPN